MKYLNKNKIDEFRRSIDEIDENIVKLLINRHEISDEIINIKIDEKLDVFDRDRENQIIADLSQKFKDNISEKEIRSVLQSILRFSKLRHNSLKKYDENRSVRDILCFKPFLIAGPCTVESEEQMEKTVPQLNDIGIKLLRGGAFKPRTSPDSFQGLGEEGLKLLKKYAQKYNMFTISELLDYEQLVEFYDYVDVIQIGSRNMMNYSFLKKTGELTAKDKKPVILKRGYGSTINEFIEAAKYLTNAGNENIILSLRGIRSFEQIDSMMRNTPDLGAILELKEKTDLNVIFDPSHATGDSRFVIDISKAALALGADGLMIETHYDPENALVDGKQSIKPQELRELITYINYEL
jgi:3-deoxy-7-phosphoheptulonate synthase